MVLCDDGFWWMRLDSSREGLPRGNAYAPHWNQTVINQSSINQSIKSYFFSPYSQIKIYLVVLSKEWLHLSLILNKNKEKLQKKKALTRKNNNRILREPHVRDPSPRADRRVIDLEDSMHEKLKGYFNEKWKFTHHLLTTMLMEGWVKCLSPQNPSPTPPSASLWVDRWIIIFQWTIPLIPLIFVYLHSCLWKSKHRALRKTFHSLTSFWI